MPSDFHAFLKLSLFLAGVGHLLIAVANFILPGMLRYRENLARVSPIIRQIFLVHAAYIVLVLVGFSGLCLFFADDLAGRSVLGRCLSGFMAVFWLSRVGLQMVYYDPVIKREHPWGNLVFTAAFLALGVVFAAACLFGK